VEDVAKAIYGLSNTEEPEKIVRFKNENPEALKELMEVLHLTLLEDGNHDDEWYKVTEYKVQQSLTIKDSLQAQRKQMQQKLKID
jgi:hypothetical protein